MNPARLERAFTGFGNRENYHRGKVAIAGTDSTQTTTFRHHVSAANGRCFPMLSKPL